MKTRAAFFLCLTGLIWVLVSTPSTAVGARPPNIVVIFADDLG